MPKIPDTLDFEGQTDHEATDENDSDDGSDVEPTTKKKKSKIMNEGEDKEETKDEQINSMNSCELRCRESIYEDEKGASSQNIPKSCLIFGIFYKQFPENFFVGSDEYFRYYCGKKVRIFHKSLKSLITGGWLDDDLIYVISTTFS